MRVDEEAIRARLGAFRAYMEELEELRDRASEYWSSRVLRRAVERLLHLAIESLLDVAQHVAVAKGSRRPESYADCFTVLEEAGLVSPERAGLYRSIARFRNILVHGYLELDPGAVYRLWVERLGDLRTMARDLLRAAGDP